MMNIEGTFLADSSGAASPFQGIPWLQHGPLQPDPIWALILDLRRSALRCPISVEEALAIHGLLLQMMSSEGWCAAQAAGLRQHADSTWLGLAYPERLRSLIRPIICKGSDDGPAFNAVFDRWLQTLPHNQSRYTDLRPEINTAPTRSGRGWLVLVAGIVLAIATLVAWGLFQSAEQPNPVAEVITPKLQGQTAQPSNLPFLQTQLWLALLSVLVVMIAFIRWMWLRHHARLHTFRSLQSQQGPPLGMALNTATPYGHPQSNIADLAVDLHRRFQISSGKLDAVRTVCATIEAGGQTRFRYRTQFQVPNYLILIDQRGSSDLQALTDNALVDRLVSHGLQVHRYTFRNDPRLCYTYDVTGLAISLIDLKCKAEGQRLLIFCSGIEFIDSYTGQPAQWLENLNAWPVRALVTPQHPSRWTTVEKLLSQTGLAIFPATPDGLTSAGQWFSRSDATFPAPKTHHFTRSQGQDFLNTHKQNEISQPILSDLRERPSLWLGTSEPDPITVRSMLTALAQHLGPRTYIWFQVCAVYPRLQQDIVLALGDQILLDQSPLYTPTGYANLCALPWFRESYIPSWLALWLLYQLPPATDQQVRDLLWKWLQPSDAPPPASFSLRKAVVHRWRRQAPNEREHIVLDYLASSRLDRLRFELPRRIHEYFIGQLRGNRFQWKFRVPTLKAIAVGAVISGLLFYARHGFLSDKSVDHGTFLINNGISFTLALGGVGLAVAAWLMIWIKNSPAGNERMTEFASAIQEGAAAYLKRQLVAVGAIAVIITILLAAWKQSAAIPVGFVVGAVCSLVAGFIGMRIAVLANVRTTQAATESESKALRVAFNGGAVTGLLVVGLALLSVGIFFNVMRVHGTEHAVDSLVGLALGSSLISVFARLGGGIYTKAADVGADLVGKVEWNLNEDDPRNAATIADNVGDNVGDCAGMAADVFETYAVSLIGALLIGFLQLGAGPAAEGAIVYPFVIGGISVIGTVLGILYVNLRSNSAKADRVLMEGVLISGLLSAVLYYPATKGLLPDSFGINGKIFTSIGVYGAAIVGLLMTGAAVIITNYYTSTAFHPVRSIAEASRTGHTTNIITGIAVGHKATALPVLCIVAAIFFSYQAADLFGIATAVMSMLSMAGIIISLDAFGPITDNAGGIAVMSGLPEEVRERTDSLDAVGNTMKAVTKGYAIASAGVAALVLFGSYYLELEKKTGHAWDFSLKDPIVLIGMFLGGLLPCLFTAWSMSAVGKAAGAVVVEVRRQLEKYPGIMNGTQKPEYAACVDIVTKAALREMVLPALLPVVGVVAIAAIPALGAKALGGMLVGTIVTGLFVGISMTSSGGAWDNAKKFIEEGHYGGRGSDAHKAAVTGDTVGDPYKDTSGPGINPMIKVVNIVAILMIEWFFMK